MNDLVTANKYYALCRKSRCCIFNDNSTQSLIRIYPTLYLAKTQGSLSSAKTQGSIHVRINPRILLNYLFGTGGLYR